MAFTVIVRGKLKAAHDELKAHHDAVVGGTQALAQQAGDLTHRIFVNPEDDRDFLGIDEWATLEGLRAFASDPRVQAFFAEMFDGPPSMTVWTGSDWKQW